jgi:hypothetical protein
LKQYLFVLFFEVGEVVHVAVVLKQNSATCPVQKLS